jgi:hypothetical protein
VCVTIDGEAGLGGARRRGINPEASLTEPFVQRCSQLRCCQLRGTCRPSIMVELTGRFQCSLGDDPQSAGRSCGTRHATERDDEARKAVRLSPHRRRTLAPAHDARLVDSARRDVYSTVTDPSTRLTHVIVTCVDPLGRVVRCNSVRVRQASTRRL